MMSITRSALRLARNSHQFSTSGAVLRKQATANNLVVKQKQEHFLTEDGVPVFLKGGVFDSLGSKFTLGLCMGSLLVGSKLVWDYLVY